MLSDDLCKFCPISLVNTSVVLHLILRTFATNSPLFASDLPLFPPILVLFRVVTFTRPLHLEYGNTYQHSSLRPISCGLVEPRRETPIKSSRRAGFKPYFLPFILHQVFAL